MQIFLIYKVLLSFIFVFLPPSTAEPGRGRQGPLIQRVCTVCSIMLAYISLVRIVSSSHPNKQENLLHGWTIKARMSSPVERVGVI
jgi:hypothetical protein